MLQKSAGHFLADHLRVAFDGDKNRGNGGFRFRVACTVRLRVPSSRPSRVARCRRPPSAACLSFNAMRTLCTLRETDDGRVVNVMFSSLRSSVPTTTTTTEMASLSSSHCRRRRSRKPRTSPMARTYIWHPRSYIRPSVQNL